MDRNIVCFPRRWLRRAAQRRRDAQSERAALQIDVVLTWNKLPEGGKVYGVLRYNRSSRDGGCRYALSHLCEGVLVLFVNEWHAVMLLGNGSMKLSHSHCSTSKLTVSLFFLHYWVWVSFSVMKPHTSPCSCSPTSETGTCRENRRHPSLPRLSNRFAISKFPAASRSLSSQAKREVGL